MNIERGVIRKVYRGKSPDNGWVALPLIELQSGKLVYTMASFQDWPLDWMGDFIGHTVELYREQQGNYILLPFHNQHQALLPALAEHLMSNDPERFQNLPLLTAEEMTEEVLKNMITPLLAAQSAINSALRNIKTADDSLPRHQKKGFLSEEARKMYAREALKRRNEIREKRAQERALTHELKELFLQEILGDSYKDRTFVAGIRDDLNKFLEENKRLCPRAYEIRGYITKRLDKLNFKKNFNNDGDGQ